MENALTHFAIYIDDLERASNFYTHVFNWGVRSFGAPDFLQITSGNNSDGPPIGALQHRKYSPVEEKVIGFECSISVENVDAVAEKIQAAGGEIVLPKTEIPGVGFVIKFRDTEGNLVCAMQYAR